MDAQLLRGALKILTKLYQLRLSHVLQEFILENQNAFLSGRSIHHSLILINEILHKAQALTQELLLLKFDVVKAFYCIGWLFMYALLRLWPKFHPHAEATNVLASSSILIQGHLMEVVQLKRSVRRQGCPLSPLLYLIVANALSNMLTLVVDEGLIVG